MALGLFFSLRQNADQRLNHEQRLLLRRALELRQELHAPTFPNALRGMGGILEADKILREIEAPGVLIGGLADAVWNRKRTEAELAGHKDVDVLILKPTEKISKFYGGIDWWLLNNIHFESIATGTGSIENVTKQFWINGCGCTLKYRITSKDALEPGLHFPTPSLAVEIRMAEFLATIDDRVTEISGDEELFTAKLRKKLGIGTNLPHFISAQMVRNPVPYIGNPDWNQVPLQVESIPREEQVAYNSR